MNQHKMHTPHELFPQLQEASISNQPVLITGDIEGKPVTFLALVKRIDLPDGDVELLVRPVTVSISPPPFSEGHVGHSNEIIIH